MSKARVWMWGTFLALAGSVQISYAGEASIDAASQSEIADLEARIEAASRELDAAARRLAELHREVGDTFHFVAAPGAGMGVAPGVAPGVPLHNRAMLGVLLGGRRGDGIEVVGVTPGGGAEAAGLLSGDVLLSIDGKALEGSAEALMERLAGREPGAIVDLEYERAGQRATAAVELRPGGPHWAMAAPFEIEIEPGASGAFLAYGGSHGGVRLFDLDSDLGSYFGVDSGVLLLRAPADVEALKSGDVIRAMDDAPVTDAGDLLRRLHQAKGDVSLDVLRRGGTERVQVDARRLAAPAPFVPFGHGAAGAGVIRFQVDDAQLPEVPPPPPAAPVEPPQPDDDTD